MSEARKLHQSKAEQERDAELNRGLAVSRQDLARMLEAVLREQKLQREETAAKIAKLERLLRSLGATDSAEGGE